jgi:epoxyqueuosine reductase
VIDAERVRTIGRQFGIDEIRITTAQPFSVANIRIKQQRDAGLYLESEHWQHRDIDRFCDVRTVLPGSKSIIAACQCYLTLETADTDTPGNPRGMVARYTWRNHYADLKERLKRLAAAMKQQYSANCLVFSNGEIAEKPIALRSGIGYYGKNSLIINQNYGSRIVLGEIITDVEIQPDQPLNTDCGECRQCIDGCPTRAFVKPFVLDRRRCIQALTNWYGVLPDDIATAWDNRFYGCSDCQDVCPANRHVQARQPRTDIGFVGPSVPLNGILKMSEQQYRTKYASNQMTAPWINFKAIQRNALVALGNIHDQGTLETLREYSQHEDPVLRQTALWALARF